MPCSCKKSSALKVAYVTPVDNTVKYTTNAAVKAQLQREVSDSFSFGAQTTPQEFCLNCVAKHLGLAYQFALQEAPQKLITVGQLLCASQHLLYTQQQASFYFKGLALRYLREEDTQTLNKELQQVLQNLSLNQQLPYTDLEVPYTDFQKYLMNLLLAYSLIFVQVMYEEVNVPWAVSHLSYASARHFLQKGNRERYQQTRELWKLIQDMKPLDSAYTQARQRFWELIQEAWGQYKASRTAVPLQK